MSSTKEVKMSMNCEVCRKELPYPGFFTRCLLAILGCESKGIYTYRIVNKDGSSTDETLLLCEEHGQKHLTITRNTVK